MNKLYGHDLTLPEIFKKVVESNGTIDDKARILLSYDSRSLRWFVDVMYNAPIKDVEIPDYMPSKYSIGNTHMSFQNSLTRLENVLQDPTSFTSKKSLRLILENVHADEAELIANLLQGKKVDGISKGVFKRAYPKFFPVSDEATLEDAVE